MKKYMLPLVCLAFYSTPAFAVPAYCILAEEKTFFDQPTVMLGIAFNFGGAASAQSFGITAKVLSNNFQEYHAASVGMTYFPTKETNNIGLDVGLAYKNTTTVGTMGWDFLNSAPQFSAGYVDAQEAQRAVFCPT